MNNTRDHSDLLLSALLEQTCEAYFVVNGEGRIVDVNDLACKSLGYTREELLKKDVWDVETTLDRDGYEAYQKAKEPNRIVHMSGSHRRKDGTEFPVDARVSLRQLDKEWHCLVLTRDDTEPERRQAEEEAIRKLRDKFWAMRTARDLQEVLNSMMSSLAELDVPFDQCGVNVIEIDRDPPLTHSHNMTKTGQWQEESQEGGNLPVIWKRQRPVYRTDIETHDSMNERLLLSNAFGRPVRSVLDVPFSHGTLAVSSSTPDAFSESDIGLVERMADVLSAGFRRWDDLQALHDEEERLQHIFHEVPIGMAVLSESGGFQEVNPAFCDLLAYAEEDLGCLTFQDVLHHGERREIMANVVKSLPVSARCSLLEGRRSTPKAAMSGKTA